MPKPSQGRFDGVWGMSKFTVEQLDALANAYERAAVSPHRVDDPKWLKRRADRIRRVAIGKEAAREHKRQQKKTAQRKPRPPHEPTEH